MLKKKKKKIDGEQEGYDFYMFRMDHHKKKRNAHMQDNLTASNLSSIMKMKVWKETYLGLIIYSCRTKLDRCTAAFENVELCAVGIGPFEEHSVNYCDLCNSKRRNIIQFLSYDFK